MSLATLSLPGVAVLQDTSRVLLTIGVGLFLGYVVLIVGANLIGLVPRYVGMLTPGKKVPPQVAGSVQTTSTSQSTEVMATTVTSQEETAA